MRLVVCAVLTGLFWVAEPPVSAKDPPAQDPMAQAFARLKAMAGEWEAAAAGPDVPKSTVTYRVIAGGSAVMESLFAGTRMEMISIYHRDGKDLVMTHYCCAGNQPRFKARLDEKTGELAFDFAGGTNIDPAKDGHIHGGRIRFQDADHVSSDWSFHANGKVVETHSLKLTRKK